jgi:hypothetical protein
MKPSRDMLVRNRRSLGGAGADRICEDRVGVIDDQQGPARRAADRLRAEALHARRRRPDPEDGVAHGQLRDELVSLADAVKNARTKRRLVERDSGACTVDPQLRLDARHRRRLLARLRHPAPLFGRDIG